MFQHGASSSEYKNRGKHKYISEIWYWQQQIHWNTNGRKKNYCTGWVKINRTCSITEVMMKTITEDITVNKISYFSCRHYRHQPQKAVLQIWTFFFVPCIVTFQPTHCLSFYAWISCYLIGYKEYGWTNCTWYCFYTSSSPYSYKVLS